MPRILKSCLVFLSIALLTPAVVIERAASSEEAEPGAALPRPEFRVGVYQFRDSEDFIQRYGHISAQFFVARTISVKADIARNSFSQEDLNLNGNGVDVVVAGSAGPFPEVSAGAGITSYDSVGVKPSALGSLTFSILETNSVTLSYKHDQVVLDSKSIGALRDTLDTDEFNPSFYKWISERWSVWAGFGYARYSDKNTRMSFNSSVTYLFRPEPEFGLAYTITYVGYEKSSEMYWDPKGYQSHGLMLILSQPLGRFFSIEFNGSPGYSPSESKANAWASMLLAFRPSRNFGIEANGHIMGNAARGGGYSASTLSLDLILSP